MRMTTTVATLLPDTSTRNGTFVDSLTPFFSLFFTLDLFCLLFIKKPARAQNLSFSQQKQPDFVGKLFYFYEHFEIVCRRLDFSL